MRSSVGAGVALIVGFWPLAPGASAATVTEADAVRRFLASSPEARRIPRVERSSRASWLEATAIPNPEVGYQVEEAAGVRDELLTFRQRLPISGRRGLLRETADAAAHAARFAAEGDLLAATTALRALFYEILYRERTLDRLHNGKDRMERIVAILAAREREGEGSGYDLLRAEQERAAVGIATSEEEAALAGARARFGAFVDPPGSMESILLVGELVPRDGLPDPEAAIGIALAQRHELRAMRAELGRLDLERRASRRRRFPEPSVSAGWKRTEAAGVDDVGYTAALTVSLPLYDRGQLADARVGAERERIGLEIEIRERQIRAEVLAALAGERAARRAAERYGESVERRAAELRRIAELAHDEGETGIGELLDAYRSSLAAELRALAVRYEARRAAIERQRAIGVEVRP